MKKNITKYVVPVMSVLLVSLFFSGFFELHAEAASIGVPQRIKDAGGNLMNAGNYHLDMEKTEWTQIMYAFLNTLNNALLSIDCLVGQMTAMLFYWCMDFDIAALFATEINKIQQTLNSGVFKPLFRLGFCGIAFVIVKNMLRRDMMGIIGQLGKVIGILLLSIFLVSNSATVLSAATGLTKGISAQVLLSMQGEEGNTSDFAATAAETIWNNLIHQPWMFLEFGTDTPDETFVDKLLKSSNNVYTNPDGRQGLVDGHTGTAFKMGRATERLGFLIFYLVPLLIKSVIYIVLGVFALGFQLFAVFYVLIAPVILVLVMFPGYESLLNAWLKKVVETQLGVLIISFIMGLVVMMDNLLYEVCSAQWGWLIVIIVQIGVALLVIMKRNELLGIIGNMQKAASSAGYSRAMLQRGDAGANFSRNAMRGIQTGTRYGVRGARQLGMRTGRAAEWMADKGVVAGAAVGTASVKMTERMTPYLVANMGGTRNEAVAVDESGEKTVERPVTLARAQKKAAATVAAGSVRAASATGAGNAAVSSPEPQIAPQRPRMDNNKIIPVEAVDGRLERVERQDESEVTKKQVERPVSVEKTGEATQKKAVGEMSARVAASARVRNTATQSRSAASSSIPVSAPRMSGAVANESAVKSSTANVSSTVSGKSVTTTASAASTARKVSNHNAAGMQSAEGIKKSERPRFEAPTGTKG